MRRVADLCLYFNMNDSYRYIHGDGRSATGWSGWTAIKNTLGIEEAIKIPRLSRKPCIPCDRCERRADGDVVGRCFVRDTAGSIIGLVNRISRHA